MPLYHLRYLCLVVAIFTLWGTCFACWSIWESVYVVVTVCICNVHHTISTSCLPLVCIMCIVMVLLADYANRTQVQKARRTELSVTAGVYCCRLTILCWGTIKNHMSEQHKQTNDLCYVTLDLTIPTFNFS